MEQLRIPCEVWSRVSGYYRPVANWNPGKQQEFKDRTTFKVVEKGDKHDVLQTTESVHGSKAG